MSDHRGSIGSTIGAHLGPPIDQSIPVVGRPGERAWPVGVVLLSAVGQQADADVRKAVAWLAAGIDAAR